MALHRQNTGEHRRDFFSGFDEIFFYICAHEKQYPAMMGFCFSKGFAVP